MASYQLPMVNEKNMAEADGLKIGHWQLATGH
jgi:hypothetical protein